MGRDQEELKLTLAVETKAIQKEGGTPERRFEVVELETARIAGRVWKQRHNEGPLVKTEMSSRQGLRADEVKDPLAGCRRPRQAFSSSRAFVPTGLDTVQIARWDKNAFRTISRISRIPYNFNPGYVSTLLCYEVAHTSYRGASFLARTSFEIAQQVLGPFTPTASCEIRTIISRRLKRCTSVLILQSQHSPTPRLPLCEKLVATEGPPF